MRRAIASLTLLLLLACDASAQRTSAPPKLQPPTALPQLSPDVSVRLVTLDRIKSGTSRKGDRIDLRVDEDVTDPNGTVLIRKGTPAYGTVVASKGAKSFGRPGKLEITIDHTTAADGRQIRLRATEKRSGKGKGSTAAAVSLLAFLPAGFWIKGKNVEMEPGMELIAYVDETLQVAPSGPAPTSTPALKPVYQPRVGDRVILSLRDGDRVTGTLKAVTGGAYTILSRNQFVSFKASDVQRVDSAP